MKKNKLKLYNEHKEQTRTITVSTTCIELIKEAINEEKYIKTNGELAHLPKNLSHEVKLVDNEYILRSNITKTNRINELVDKFAIYRRIKTIRDLYGLYYLTPKGLLYSGMMYQAFLYYSEYEKLDNAQYEKIAKQFDTDIYIVKRYIDVDKIEELYNKYQEVI